MERESIVIFCESLIIEDDFLILNRERWSKHGIIIAKSFAKRFLNKVNPGIISTVVAFPPEPDNEKPCGVNRGLTCRKKNKKELRA